MFSGKTIFIAPLDWGLGHTTRCVPLIRLLSKNNTVILGVTSQNAFFMEQHFQGHQKIILPSYNIRYSARLPAWLNVLLQWPAIHSVIKKEHALLDALVSRQALDIVISDNRFGLSSKAAKSIFITHQLQVKAPFFSGLANRLNKRYIHRFSEAWVPDYKAAEQRLAGELSDGRGIAIPLRYLGPQSYLEDDAATVKPAQTTDYLLLLSGAEPQRSILEKLLVKKFSGSGKSVVLVRGSSDAPAIQADGIEVIDFASGRELRQLIVNAETVICRSGYSTLMDLHVLGKKELVLIPTPGQTEQEYLAGYWAEKFAAVNLTQYKIKSHTF